MFSTCLYFFGALGRNEVLEAFPIGRRLAFDARRRRLWVVCRGCRNWNLSPLEERWEAVEACERLYRQTSVRVSSDQIGLETLSEGLDLVRIGTPLRPEFAAWRSGGGLRTRRLQLPDARAMATTFLSQRAATMVGAVAAMAGVTYTLTSSRRWQRAVVDPLEQVEARLQYDRTIAGGTPGQVLEATRRITDVGDAEQYVRSSIALRVTRRAKHTIF